QSHNSLLVVTFDEDNGGALNHIMTLFVGPMVQAGRYTELLNHYGVLRTIEDMYGLPYAGNEAAVAPLADAWTVPAGTVATPTFTPNGGMFNGTVSVSLAEATPGASIFYTTDGSTPTIAATPYAGPFALTADTTVSALAVAPGLADSAVARAYFDARPSVALTAPANNATIAPGSTITLSATASDPGGSIAWVSFYANGTLIGKATAAPYAVTWSNVA